MNNTLVKNSMYNVIYKCVNVIFPLVTMMYVSRILLVDGIGKVSSAQNIVSYFTLLAALGLPTYGVKQISIVRDNQTKTDKIFSELFLLNLCSSLLFSGAYYFMIFQFSFFSNEIVLYSIIGMLIIFNILNVDWFYQGREEYKYITIRSIMIKFLCFIFTILFINHTDDYLKYALILVLASVMNYVYNVIHLRKYTSLVYKGLDLKRHIVPILTLFIAVVAIEIYTLIDTTMLTVFYGDTEVGYYTTASKGIKVIRTLVTSVSAVFLPRISYYYASEKKEKFMELIQVGFKILFFISIPIAVGVLLTANDLVLILFGTSYIESGLIMKILSLSIITVAISNFIGYQILISIGREKDMMISTIIGAVVNIILNILLIFPYKYNGVAVASVLTELSVVLYQILIMKKYISIKLIDKNMITIIFSTVIMSVIVLILNYVIINIYLRFFLSVVIGGGIYLYINLLFKNEFIVLLKEKFYLRVNK